LNPAGGIQHYPGSPEVIRRMLRPQDRILLNELHSEDRNTLASRFIGDERVRVSGVDASQAVKTALPFAERRGLVLIDPAFEVADETDRAVRMVQQGLRRQASVTFMVWYPVTTLEFADSFCNAIKTLGAPNSLDARVMVKEPHQEAGLAGSGLIIINPPWTLHDELQTLLPALAQILGKGKWGKGSVRWLTPPK
jgi:23S rRNA (adenine2030-N6)-methyltransferase